RIPNLEAEDLPAPVGYRVPPPGLLPTLGRLLRCVEPCLRRRRDQRQATDRDEQHHQERGAAAAPEQGDLSSRGHALARRLRRRLLVWGMHEVLQQKLGVRSEEHTSELQSRENLVCRHLLEKNTTSS